jgi:hypothetical protein
MRGKRHEPVMIRRAEDQRMAAERAHERARRARLWLRETEASMAQVASLKSVPMAASMPPRSRPAIGCVPTNCGNERAAATTGSLTEATSMTGPGYVPSSRSAASVAGSGERDDEQIGLARQVREAPRDAVDGTASLRALDRGLIAIVPRNDGTGRTRGQRERTADQSDAGDADTRERHERSRSGRSTRAPSR